MKKTYIAPEMEIKKFSVEDIMTASTVDIYKSEDTTSGAAGVASINYEEVFGI